MERNVASLGRFGLGGIAGRGLGARCEDEVPLLLVRLGCAGIFGKLRLVGIVDISGFSPLAAADPVEADRGNAASLGDRNHPKLLRPLLRMDDEPETPATLMMLAGRRLSPLRFRMPRPPSVEVSELVDLLARLLASYRDGLPLAAALARSFSTARCAFRVRWYNRELR